LRSDEEGYLLKPTIFGNNILLVVKADIEQEEATLLDGVGVVVAIEVLCTRQHITYGYASEG
jgi:hypothetical protein